MSEDDQVLERAAQWLAEDRGVALATVVRTWGSSPRAPGSMLAVAGDGAFVGSVSGGCIEGAVVAEAETVIAGGGGRKLEFGVSDEKAWEVGLACGGQVEVYLEKLADPGLPRRLLNERPLARVVHLESGAQALVRGRSVDGDLELGSATVKAARKALHDDRSTMVEDDAGAVFVQVFNPPPRMIIVGAVHIAQCLAPMAAMAGFQVTVVDPRRAFATGERFPGTTLDGSWPDEALRGLAPDSQTAVITLVHDPKLDDPALEEALGSEAYYIAALGSRRSHAERLQRLAERGFGEMELARIHGPAGLDLGGRKASEIAVSILAQAIAARYGGKGA